MNLPAGPETQQNMQQKRIFLESEGDAWLRRNEPSDISRKLPEEDRILQEMLELFPGESGVGLDVLEVGCGGGTRLAWLNANLGMSCAGIDPSAEAVRVASAKGVKAYRGTADALPFEEDAFDIVVFGFCLYLCDRDDLPTIASEADRVLRSPGWLLIMDFYSPLPRALDYHHRKGVRTYKMDYRTLFNGYPDYECMTHKVRHHADSCYTDDPEEWVAVSVLRKSGRGPAD